MLSAYSLIAHEDAEKAYRSKLDFARMSLTNIAKAGVFSSDRAIKEYADNIWNMNY